MDLGRLENDYIGIPIIVKQKKQIDNKKSKYDLDGEIMSQNSIVHEIKRVGLLIDRYVDLEMRVGDHLVFYISKSQA